MRNMPVLKAGLFSLHSVQCWSCSSLCNKGNSLVQTPSPKLESPSLEWKSHKISRLRMMYKLNGAHGGKVWWADSKQADFYMWFCSQVWWLSSSVELPRHIIHTITCQLSQGVAPSRQGCLLHFLKCIAVVVHEFLFLQDLFLLSL